MANNANDVLAKARSQIGYSRWTDPNPGTIYGRWYAKYTGVPYYGTNGVPYCAMFASWCFNQVGAKCAGLPAAYCPYIVRDAKAAKKTVAKSSAKPGDVVLFDWEGDGVADHVGIVESNHGSYMTCIEGNTDNGVVARKNRAYSSICCVVRPDYDGSITGPGIIQAAPNMTASQLWKLEEAEDGWIRVINKGGKVLDVKGGTGAPMANGRYVQAYKPNNTDAQLWRNVDGVGGGFRLVSKLDPTYCLDVKNGTVSARKNIQLHKLQDDPASQWAQSFVAMPYSGGEWVTLLNCKSLYAIDANPSGYDYN